MSNNSETVRDTRNMSMNHDYETGVAFSDSVNKTCVKRPLAEKSLWSHFRLAMKPRYLGNHASQLKNYYGTLSGSHGRSFRTRHENSPGAPTGGEITMTLYPVGNKTSLSRKPCIPDKMLLWITIMKSCSPSNFYKKTANINSKTFQFINVVNGVSHSHKTANILFSFDSVA